MALDRQPGLMDIGYPLFHFQDLKNSGVSGGWADINNWTSPDITTIVFNEITGATITTRDVSDNPVTSGVVGTHGKQSAIINNPANGTHNDFCYFTLPEGKYHFTLFTGYWEIGQTGSPGGFQLYNLSDSEIICNLDLWATSANYKFSNTCTFNLNGSKNLKLRALPNNGMTETVSGFGSANSSLNQSDAKLMQSDYKIYKIG